MAQNLGANSEDEEWSRASKKRASVSFWNFVEKMFMGFEKKCGNKSYDKIENFR